MYNIVILGLTSLLTDIASEMVYPLVPFFLTATLGASPAILGVIEGFAESLASVLKVFSGYLSDRLKRRKELAIAGYASSSVGKLLLFLATGWGMVLAGRLVDRFGKGIRTAPRDALIADSALPGQRGKAFGLHRAMDTAGAAAGVLIAYLFLASNRVEYTSIFLWSVIPATLGVLLLLFVRETKQAVPARRMPSLRWSVLPRRLKLFLLVALLFTLGNSSNTFLLLRAQNLGFTPAAAILLYLLYNVVFGLVSYPAGRWSDRFGRKKLLVIGYGFYGLVYVGFAMLTESAAAPFLWGLFGMYGLYSALTEGIEKALVSDLAAPDIRATAIGLHATVVGIGLLPASLIAGGLWASVSPAAPFWFGGAMGFAAMLGLLVAL